MTEIITAAVTAGAAFLGVLVSQLFLRAKNRAEAEAATAGAHKSEAEAQSIEVDSRLKVEGIYERLSAIEHQVKNEHRTNLRQDIDKSNRTADNVLEMVRMQADAYSRDRKETLAWRQRLVDSMKNIEVEIGVLREEHQAAAKIIALHTKQLAQFVNQEGEADEDKSDLVA